ncbi:MAG: VWA domain-containing protein [Planctomycetes bacterium]|nr:VWA domain-containing protein [Planctomycetota bacterium]
MEWTRPALLALASAALLIYYFARRAGRTVLDRPAVQFYDPTPRDPAAARGRPRLSTWFAIASVILAAIAAAGPRIVGSPAVDVVFDCSGRMAWKSADGRTRFERARASALQRIAALAKDTKVALMLCPGGGFEGTPESVAAVVRNAKLQFEYYDIQRAALASPRRKWIFTGAELSPIPGVEIIQFGAGRENAGLSLTAGPGGRAPWTPGIVITNAGNATARRTLAGGKELLTIDLAARESRWLPVESGASRIFRISGGADACEADDEITIPARGLNLQFPPDAPEALVRALNAVRDSRGGASSEARALLCFDGSEKPGASGIEFTVAKGGDERPRALPGSPVADLAFPGRVRATPVNCKDPWIVNDRGETLAGLDGGRARIGFDWGDPVWTDSPAAPALVAAMADALLDAAPADSPDPRITMELGAERDADLESVEKPSDPGFYEFGFAFAALAAVAALAAAFFELPVGGKKR